MKNVLCANLGAVALLFASPAFAQTDIRGWWRADITYLGETEPFYL